MKHYRRRAALCCVGLLILSYMDIDSGPLLALAMPLTTLVVQFEMAARRQEGAEHLRRRYGFGEKKKTARCGDTEAVNAK